MTEKITIYSSAVVKGVIKNTMREILHILTFPLIEKYYSYYINLAIVRQYID